MACYKVIQTKEELRDFFDTEIQKDAKSIFSKFDPFWSGIEWFIEWCKSKVQDFLINELSKIPVIGKWASRIGVTTVEFGFSIAKTTINFMRTAFNLKNLWNKAHESAIRAWESNEQYGVLIQAKAYGKKLALYFFYVIKECLERAIKNHERLAHESGLLDVSLSENEKQDISTYLDKYLADDLKPE